MDCKKLSLLTLVACFALISCEQIIDVDLNSAAPKYVIEGAITDSNKPHQIKITQTKDFDEKDDFKGVDNAEVFISDDKGNSEFFIHADSGVYHGNDFSGVSGSTYTLTVDIEDETFTASSKMPDPVEFRELNVEVISILGNTIMFPNALFPDPEGIDNYYRHILFVNKEKSNSIFVSSDDLFDGNYVERTLPYGDFENGLNPGDTILVEMQSIDKNIYEYFSSLLKTINRSAASPANPTTNISGGALGYFSAHTVQTRSVVIDNEN
ncbi:MAG: DUF4249 domain-containing protein [Balneolales bacterium]